MWEEWEICTKVSWSISFLLGYLLHNWQFQIEAVAIFLLMFGAHMNILFIFKVKILLKDHIGPLNYVDY